MLGLVNNCQAEMSSYMPVTGGFIRMSGKWVDEALGFMIGWSELRIIFSEDQLPVLNQCRLLHLRGYSYPL